MIRCTAGLQMRLSSQPSKRAIEMTGRQRAAEGHRVLAREDVEQDINEVREPRGERGARELGNAVAEPAGDEVH